MGSSTLMASSTSNSDLRRNPVSLPDPTTQPDSFHNLQTQQILLNTENNNNNNHNVTIGDLDTSSTMTVEGFSRNAYVGAGAGAAGESQSSDFAEISLLDAAGAIAPITETPVRRKTVDDVWREIVAGKTRATTTTKSEQQQQRRVECKEEAMDDMMTLEDFLVKAGAVEEGAVVAGAVEGEVKVEVGASGDMFAYESPCMARHGSVDSAGVLGYGRGVEVVGRGKRRAESLLEPLDKAAQQRQRRMIKNRESAARSRERKQAYQFELESMAGRLEEENEQLLKEKAERTKERRKLLMEKVIPVVEKRRPARALRRVKSMLW